MRCVATPLILTFYVTNRNSALGYRIQKCVTNGQRLRQKLEEIERWEGKMAKCGMRQSGCLCHYSIKMFNENKYTDKTFLNVVVQNTELLTIQIDISVDECMNLKMLT